MAGAAALLSACVPPGGEASELVGLVSAGAARLSALLEDLLDFGSVGAGALRMRPAPFDVRADLVRPLRRLLEACAAGDAYALADKLPRVALRYAVDDAVPRRLVGDVARLHQCGLNLLTNVRPMRLTFAVFCPYGSSNRIAPAYRRSSSRRRAGA